MDWRLFLISVSLCLPPASLTFSLIFPRAPPSPTLVGLAQRRGLGEVACGPAPLQEPLSRYQLEPLQFDLQAGKFLILSGIYCDFLQEE